MDGLYNHIVYRVVCSEIYLLWFYGSLMDIFKVMKLLLINPNITDEIT